MTRAAHPGSLRDPFHAARSEFEQMLEWLAGADVPTDHSALENGLLERGYEVMRCAYQAHLDKLSEQERREAKQHATPEGIRVRSRTRQLESTVGRLQFRRLAYKATGMAARYPLDERLNLPADVYTHPVRRRMSEEARRGSWQQGVDSIDRTTAAHVPKRQAEEITVRAAQDFETFYAERVAANDTASANTLLVLSSDSKGITMRPESLRDATRKEAEKAEASAVRGDPMATKKPRKHDKRMAVVTAVWDQEPHVRTAEEVVDKLRRDREPSRKKAKTTAPKPRNKRVSATVEKNLPSAIIDMFDEAERRDPDHSRTTVVLVDGSDAQSSAIQEEARKRDMNISIVVDIIHVLHYLWMAGFALCKRNEAKTAAWVASYLLKLLTRPAVDVVAGIRQAATLRGLTATERRPVEKCAKYLHANGLYLRYDEFLAKGFPIATGVIEGACRYLIQDRLGITGARWNLAAAEAILRLRALHSSGDWDEYWAYHLRRELMRNYARAA
jgi:hypothetical protein